MEDQDKRRRYLAHWAEFYRLTAEYNAKGVDYCYRRYPEFPADLRDMTCGAKSKRTGQPCKSKVLYKNGRCKFHGGLSTGPTTQQGKQQSAANGKKGGRPTPWRADNC